MALPDPDLNAIFSPCPASQLQKMWPDLENLVSDGYVAALGVADLSADDLDTVWNKATKIKPLVNHYNLEACKLKI